jgi:hypothetical protein
MLEDQMPDTLEWTESTPKNATERKAFARETVALVQQTVRVKLVLTPERYKRHQAAMQVVASRYYGENLKVAEPNARDNRHTYSVTALMLVTAIPLYERMTGFKLSDTLTS